MNEMFYQYAASLIRAVGTPVIVWLTAHGYLTESETASAVLIVATLLVNIVWSFANKFIFNKKVEIALDLPAGSSQEKLKDVLARS